MSKRRITAVVVDVTETLFSLDAVEEALDHAGAGAHARERLFAALAGHWTRSPRQHPTW